MTATYGTCTMQMPSTYVSMDAEEMTYLEGGGYVAYRGTSAWLKISSMLASVTTWGGTATQLMGIAAASACATGVGTVIAVAAAVGAMFTVAAAGIQSAMVGAAILLTISSGGFRASDTGFWMWSWTSVKPLWK